MCIAQSSLVRAVGDDNNEKMTMKPLHMKLVLSTLAIVAMLTGPAFAQKPRHVIHVNQSAAYDTIPGYNKDGSVIEIAAPGYDTNGGIIGTASLDQFSAQSQH